MPELSSQEQLGQSGSESRQPIIRYLDLSPRTGLDKLMRQIRPDYKINSTLVLAKAQAVNNMDFSRSSLELGSSARNPALEETQIEDPVTHEVVRPREIADTNFREMERATSLKWYIALSRLFRSPQFSKVPIHSPDGRLKIAVPGCHLGFEIGGVMDFFNEHRIPIDLDAVDINEAGAERKFMRLEERCGILGSQVNFFPNTDAREFFKGKRSDLAILRHPGFIFEPSEYYIWKEIVETMSQTKPGIMIVSTYNHRLKDPHFIEEVLQMKGKKEIYEGEVFDKLLGEKGYRTTGEFDASVMDDRLEYPLSPYMIAFENKEGRLGFTVPVDREITIYGSEEYRVQSRPE